MNKWILIGYVVFINLLAVILTVVDKRNSRRYARRVSEKALLMVAALGGSVAMLLTMIRIRHKTHHTKFMVGIPAIIVVQIVLLVWILDTKYRGFW